MSVPSPWQATFEKPVWSTAKVLGVTHHTRGHVEAKETKPTAQYYLYSCQHRQSRCTMHVIMLRPRYEALPPCLYATACTSMCLRVQHIRRIVKAVLGLGLGPLLGFPLQCSCQCGICGVTTRPTTDSIWMAKVHVVGGGP
jgi:hypothetical protein